MRPASYPFSDQIQPASLICAWATVAYRVRASFLPGKGAHRGDRLDEFHAPVDLTGGAVLEKGLRLCCAADGIAAPAQDLRAAAASPKARPGGWIF